MSDFLLKKSNGFYYYNRRVLVHIKKITARRFVQKSLKTKNYVLALAKDMSIVLEQYWTDLETIKRENAKNRYQSAQKI